MFERFFIKLTKSLRDELNAIGLFALFFILSMIMLVFQLSQNEMWLSKTSF